MEKFRLHTSKVVETTEALTIAMLREKENIPAEWPATNHMDDPLGEDYVIQENDDIYFDEPDPEPAPEPAIEEEPAVVEETAPEPVVEKATTTTEETAEEKE